MLLPQTRADIEKCIPHAGAMCLLEKVLHCDDYVIRCETATHRDPANPLRNAQGLPVSAALEYAAQAAAVHGNLLQTLSLSPATTVRGGYLAVLSNVQWQEYWLHRINNPLCVDVRRESESDGGIDCSFSIHANGKTIVTGSMVVALMNTA
jgi:predicted hotdog family 3-hydroxylacyl-ACP dehydratase